MIGPQSHRCNKKDSILGETVTGEQGCAGCFPVNRTTGCWTPAVMRRAANT
jgi:hypothetical protein